MIKVILELATTLQLFNSNVGRKQFNIYDLPEICKTAINTNPIHHD